MDEFHTIWNDLQTSLKPGTEIKHWNPYNGYLGDSLIIISSDPKSISIDPPRVWDSQVILKDDFKQVWDIWIDYLALRLERREIHALTGHSKYIISILHWYETECRSLENL